MRRVLLLIVLLSLAFAPAPLPRSQRRTETGARGMEGLWADGPHRLLIMRGCMICNPGPSAMEYELVVDASASPQAYDIRVIAGSGRWAFSGIYRVEGDRLLISYNSADRGRPTAFRGPGQGGNTRFYKRVRR